MRCAAGSVCIGFQEARTGDEALGRCHVATAGYVPSYSLRPAGRVSKVHMRHTHALDSCEHLSENILEGHPLQMQMHAMKAVTNASRFSMQ